MVIKNSLVSALRALKRNKMRTSLTSIGIIIGVSSVIVMVGIGNSARVSVKDKIYTFGINAISIFSYDKRFNIREINEIKNFIPYIKFITPIFVHDTSLIKYKNKNRITKCFGVNNDYFKIKNWQLLEGSYFSEDNIKSLDKVVIIGNSIDKQFFAHEKPIGKVIQINKIPFRVIGTLEEMGVALSGRDFDNPVFVPYTTAEIKVVGKKDAHLINAASVSEDVIEETEKELRQYMKRLYSLEESPKFRIITSKKQLKVAEDISKTLSLLLAGIASISLLVGGVGIMNIMLVSVTERTKEIGIRMSVGAKSRDILFQFLVESVMLSSAGGIIGIIFGLSIYYLLTIGFKYPFIFSFLSIFISFLFSAFVGIMFGFYPAKKASKLNPIDALRHE